MNDTDSLVELRDIRHRYEDGPRVLDGLDLTVAVGETLAVVGPSGCGKSTLLNVIGALDGPTGGQVRIAGQDPTDMAESALAHLRAKMIGFVFQIHHLLPQCSVWENVLLPTLPGGNMQAAEDRARRLLERVGLADKHAARPGELSGGQRQRVAVVRALVNGPKLLLADEPTGSLDEQTADELAGLLVELNREEGVTLITVTHSARLANHMNRQLQLRDGTLHETP
ncbi:MAG: ATP-binding cassette domain-containing protein [Planctomycetes bacterium]|jgi:lipoprotein-releasing system ATP-binding protein|nr:ABC transporter ATP-binding protein [Phycisphaerae bacterium]NBB96257.1 ATP-binding cassette domain-containing protein [Planctomycetota bacterium]